MTPDLEPDDVARLFDEITGDTPTDRLMCNCSCNTGVQMHSDRKCSAPATEYLTLHRLGYCNEPPAPLPDGDLGSVDEDGNICLVMCTRCAEFAEQAAHVAVKRAAAHLHGAIPSCPSCNRPIKESTDLVTRREL